MVQAPGSVVVLWVLWVYNLAAIARLARGWLAFSGFVELLLSCHCVVKT